MSDIRPANPSSDPSKQPLALLDSQVQLLGDIREIQKNQQAQLEELRNQNERLISLLSARPQPGDEAATTRVKVENINMPFLAMVGFLIKISIASIPAMIIIGLLYFAIIALLAMLGVGIGGMMGGFR